MTLPPSPQQQDEREDLLDRLEDTPPGEFRWTLRRLQANEWPNVVVESGRRFFGRIKVVSESDLTQAERDLQAVREERDRLARTTMLFTSADADTPLSVAGVAAAEVAFDGFTQRLNGPTWVEAVLRAYLRTTLTSSQPKDEPQEMCCALEPGSPMTGLGPRRCTLARSHDGEHRFDWAPPKDEQEANDG